MTLEHFTMDPSASTMLASDAATLLGLAIAMQGTDALACTRRHAALHEAGHAVMYTVEGLRVLSVAVFRRGGNWLGLTNSSTAWEVSPGTDPKADLRRARILLAGPLAELAFSGKPALGAGIDEIVLARSIVATASIKLSASPEELMMRVVMETIETLAGHRSTLDALADALMRRPKIKQIELAKLLRHARPADIGKCGS